MKKKLLIFALLLGVVIPFAAQAQELHYALAALTLTGIVLTLRGGSIGMVDCLILFITLIPFHHFRIGTEDIFLRPTELAFIPLGLLWSARALVRPETEHVPGHMPAPREYKLLALFLMLSLISASRALSPAVSGYRTAVLTYMIVFSFLVLDIINTEQKLLRVVNALIVVAGVSGIWGVFQMFIPRLTPFHVVHYPTTTIGPFQLFRASAGWDNPNYFALFLSLVIPITAVMAFSRSCAPARHLFYRGFLGLQVVGLIATYSRNGAISTAAALLFLLWVLRRKAIVIAVVVLLICALWFVWTGKDYLAEHMHFLYAFFLRAPLQDVRSAPESVLIFRWDAWRANIGMFLEHPLLGVGPFMAGRNYYQFKPRDAAFQGTSLEPHNEFISLLSERGIFGFLLLTAFLYLLLKRGIAAYRKRPGEPAGAFALGAAGSIVCFSVSGLAEAVLTDVTFWLITGLLFAACRLIREARAP